jgi:di/tricarboxylate transporter
MRTAKFIAVVVAVISGLLVFAGVASATKEGAAGMGAGAFFGVLVGFLLGAVFYQWWYNSGLRMVLSAQQMLVAIDTEHNTREIAETLRASG